MAKLNQDFVMFAGDSKEVKITVIDVNGNPKDLSGASIEWKLKKSGQIFIDKSTSNGIDITDPVNGEFVVTLLPSDTEGFIFGGYTHQAEVMDVNDDVEIVTQGVVTIKDSFFN